MFEYFCKHCREFFTAEDAGKIYDDPSPSGVGLPPGYEVYTCCPYCGSMDFEEVYCDEECEDCKFKQYCDYAGA